VIFEHERLLADTGPFCRCAEAGEAHLDIAAEYLRGNVAVVLDVHQELRSRSKMSVHSRLTRLALLGVPASDPIEITDRAVLVELDTILSRRRRTHPGHEREDRGEVATALAAHALGVPVLMDDGFGKLLAARRGVTMYTTQDLAVELAARNVLGRRHALGIFRIVYKGALDEDFDARVDTLMAELTG